MKIPEVKVPDVRKLRDDLVLVGHEGTITVPASVLAQIATQAAESVSGVRVLRRRRSVDLADGTVELGVAAGGDEPLARIAAQAQEAVSAALETMCGLRLRVNVAVEEIS